jgi:dipeptidyl aminopeptidase/acylaminoacyl peptidase
MSELKLRPPKESGNGASLKIGRCEIGKKSQEIQERTASEGGSYKIKQRQSQKGTMYRAPTGAWLRKRFLHKRRNSLIPEGVSYRIAQGVITAVMISSLPWGMFAQNMEKAVVTVDDEVTAFTYAPDGRIVFSARKMYKAKKYDLERDDIYVLEQNGKRKKIFSGEKFTLGDKPFTYLIEGFTWSPNGKIVAVQMYTTTVDIDDGTTQDARGLLFLDDQGRMLKPGKDPVVLDAQNPLWLRDNQTMVYMTNKDMPLGVYSLQYLNVSSGPAGKAFEGRTFLDAARISGSNSAMAVERDRNMDGPPRIQKLELLSQETQEVATLDEFAGELSLSPSGTKAAYYLDKEVLEIRDLMAPNKLARMRVGLGVLQWSEDETRILLKRTLEKKSADLVWVAVPELKAYANRAEIPIDEPTPNFLLHGLTIREYAISPDGKFLGVVLPGKRNLEIFSMR